MLSPFTFQMGLIIYVGLLLLTPKVPSLPFDPQDNAFLSWVHSYTAFHSLISGSAEHSPLHQLKVSHGGFLHFKEKTFFNSVNIFTNNCRELVWGPPPVAMVMRKEARHTQRWDGAWKIARTEKSGGPRSMGSQRVRHDCVTFTFLLFKLWWR